MDWSSHAFRFSSRYLYIPQNDTGLQTKHNNENVLLLVAEETGHEVGLYLVWFPRNGPADGKKVGLRSACKEKRTFF
jgi:hypothetical protein